MSRGCRGFLDSDHRSRGASGGWEQVQVQVQAQVTIREKNPGGARQNCRNKRPSRDGATLRLKEGAAFYAPSPLQCIAIHWPKLVAGAQSGELYCLEVQD